MSTTSPVRNPDLRSPEIMTRRAWWLVGLNLLVPGSAQVLAGSRRLGRFGLAATIVSWGIALVVVAAALLDRSILIRAVTNPVVLAVLIGVLAFYATLWVVLTLDTLRLVRFVRVSGLARAGVALLAVSGLVIASGGAGFAAVNAVSAMSLLTGTFSNGEIAEPVDGRYNILLLGGDAGPDRVGLRPDSISVVSIDAASGAVTIFGVPRNLENAQFSADSPMLEAFPEGYNCGVECLISYLYTYGQEHPELYPDAEAAGSNAGIEAMRDAVSGTLGLSLQYYVLIDMEGFEELIDALGGIDIDVAERLPIGANTFDDGTPADPIGYIEAGLQHMDGETALWYARTRYGSNDYERMERQRQVQEAILAQANPANVIVNFRAIAEAGGDVVSTDIPSAMLSFFAELAEQSREQPIATVDFVPPEFDPDAPDIEAIRERVAEALAPATPAPEE